MKLNTEAHLFKSYSPSGSSKTIKLHRKAPNVVENIQTASFYIPGFDIKWHYTGLEKNITERGYYYNNNNPITKLFIRNYSTNNYHHCIMIHIRSDLAFGLMYPNVC